MVKTLQFSAGLASVLFAARAMAYDDGTPIPRELVIISQPGVTLDDIRAAHPALVFTDLRQFSPARIHLVQVPLGQEDAYEIELAADVALVRSVEQNKTVASPEEGTTQSLFLRTTAGTYRGQQAVADINATQPAPFRAPVGTIVAVLDTGVAPHPDLVARFAPGGYNFITDTAASDESACAPGSGLVGHGTHVAGVIALIDPDATILPITVLDCNGVGNAFAVACGIFHAIDMGAGVINMSFATTLPSDAVELAVVAANTAGIACVASVSNNGIDTVRARSFPAEHDQVVGVGGLTRQNGPWERAPFSDWGRSLDIAAPAVNIQSMWYDGATYGYATGSGTSFAAALVSGVASIVRAKYGPQYEEWMPLRFCATGQRLNIGEPYGMGCGHNDDGIATLIDAVAAVCSADINNDGFVDFFDYSDYVEAFESGAPAADMNRDDFVDFFDYDAYVGLFEAGC